MDDVCAQVAQKETKITVRGRCRVMPAWAPVLGDASIGDLK
jgi:hypothetical protein